MKAKYKKKDDKTSLESQASMNASFNASADGTFLSNRKMKVMYNEVINDE